LSGQRDSSQPRAAAGSTPPSPAIAPSSVNLAGGPGRSARVLGPARMRRALISRGPKGGDGQDHFCSGGAGSGDRGTPTTREAAPPPPLPARTRNSLAARSSATLSTVVCMAARVTGLNSRLRCVWQLELRAFTLDCGVLHGSWS
jgi:hypothetical protein